MQNPTYLTTSRHNVFFFRFPIPKNLHPQGKASEIRISLQTRCPHTALHLSRTLAYFGHRAIQHQAFRNMDYQHIRQVLTDYFKAALERKKQEIAALGRLDDNDKAALENSMGFATDALTHKDYSVSGRPEDLARFIALTNLPITEGTKEYETLRTEFITAHRDYCKAVLAYDASLGSFDYSSPQPLPSIPQIHSRKKLAQAITEYVRERKLGKVWTAKSAKSYESQFAVLTDFLGDDATTYISRDGARGVKDMLNTIPKNRKGMKYKGKTLRELMVLKLPEHERMTPQNVNKYLHTYSTFFDWAVQQGTAPENNFKGITVKLAKDEQPRDAFTHGQLAAMLNEIRHNRHGLMNKDYQKWAVLIGVYTGARLNEIAQLELSDIRQVDGIWCFDINDDGDNDRTEKTKRLKNKASKRLVPIHSHLLSWGILAYVETLKQQGHKRLLHELTYDKNNGYGRNLSRWFNETFTVKLGIRTKKLVFHSLRHTLATALVQAGVPDPLTQDIIGHKKAGTMQGTYAKGYLAQQRKDALEKIYQDLPTA